MNDLLLPLYQAYYSARQNKRNTINQLKFEFDFEKNLYLLAQEIKSQTYKVSPCIAFIINNPIKREIFAATFRDRVVHHLVFTQIYDFWDHQFIYDSYSCRLGKGTHFGINRLSQFMRASSDNYTKNTWVLKLDISGYFMHVNREKVYQNCLWGLKKQFREQKYKSHVSFGTLDYLLQEIIFADPTIDVRRKSFLNEWDDLPLDKSLFFAPAGCGFPIGNLTSQLFSNIYLHQLDKLVKYKFKMKYYGRYVDDCVFIDQDKNKLLAICAEIRHFLKEKLYLDLHPKKIYLQPYQYGVPFLGAIIKPYHILPGKRLVRNYHRCQQKWLQAQARGDGQIDATLAQSYQSYLGHLSKFRSYRLTHPPTPLLISN